MMDNIKNIEKNKIIGDIILENSTIEFIGENNILYVEGNIKFVNSKLRFTGSNSIMYFDKNKMDIYINARTRNDSVLYLGKDTFINKGIDVYATERKNIIIGNGCMLSYETAFRTTDPHLIFDCNTKNRINHAKSILIGDHVWIGQQCLILKNTQIFSGSIIGGHSVLSNKKVYSNSLWAGNPAKKIKEDVFFSCKSAHDFSKEEENMYSSLDSEEYIFEDTGENNLEKIDLLLQEKESNTLEKLEIITKLLCNNDEKNRFALKDR